MDGLPNAVVPRATLPQSTLPRVGKMEEYEAFVGDERSAEELVQRVAEGETLKEFCRSRNLPYGRVAQWICENEGVLGKYEAALRLWADALAQEAVQLAREATPQTVGVAKLRIGTHLKLAGKWDRERYGERLRVDGAVRVPVDAGLVGLAGEMLARITGRAEHRVLEAEHAPHAEPDDVSGARHELI